MSSSGRLRQPLHLEILGDGQERVPLVGTDDHLAMVYKPEDVLQDRELNTVEIDDRVRVRIAEEDGPQLRTSRARATL